MILRGYCIVAEPTKFSASFDTQSSLIAVEHSERCLTFPRIAWNDRLFLQEPIISQQFSEDLAIESRRLEINIRFFWNFPAVLGSALAGACVLR